MTTKRLELTDDLKLWTDGQHTVTTLEVQAVKLWARLMHSILAMDADPQARIMGGYLLGAANETDEATAELIMHAKRARQKAGERPLSAEPIPQ